MIRIPSDAEPSWLGFFMRFPGRDFALGATHLFKIPEKSYNVLSQFAFLTRQF